jgi:hypothetical protein
VHVPRGHVGARLQEQVERQQLPPVWLPLWRMTMRSPVSGLSMTASPAAASALCNARMISKRLSGVQGTRPVLIFPLLR